MCDERYPRCTSLRSSAAFGKKNDTQNVGEKECFDSDDEIGRKLCFALYPKKNAHVNKRKHNGKV